MDSNMANLLKDVLNVIKYLYDIAGSLEEPVFRPLMAEAMNIAKTLKLPYDVNVDECVIEQWIHITPAKINDINELLKVLFKNGDAG